MKHSVRIFAMGSAAVLFAAMCASCGEGDGDDIGSGNTNVGGDPVNESDLVGTWEQTYGDEVDTLELKADGTWSEIDGYDGYVYEGTWSVDGNVFTMSEDDSGNYVDDNGENVEYEGTETWSETFSIVGGKLYLGTIIRTSGSGSSLNGTWKTTEREAETGVDDGIEFDYKEVYSLSIKIDGNTYTSTETETGYEEEDGVRDTFDETYNESGFIYEDGHLVVLAEEALSEDVSLEDVLIEYSYSDYGYRISADVIIDGVATAEEAAAEAYVKVD